MLVLGKHILNIHLSVEFTPRLRRLMSVITQIMDEFTGEGVLGMAWRLAGGVAGKGLGRAICEI